MRTTPRDERTNRRILYAIAGSGFVMVGVVLAFLLFAGGGEGEEQRGAIATLRAAGFTYQHPKGQGRDHVEALPEGYKPNSTPRSSGPHAGETMIYGTYEDPISELHIAHNFEHGAVAIRYGPDVPAAEVNRLLEYYREDPNGLIVAPHPALGNQIALTAWTHVAKGRRFDEEAFDAFIDAFGFKGPESCKTAAEQGCFRREDMQPGGP
jgi:hypothetical protein